MSTKNSSAAPGVPAAAVGAGTDSNNSQQADDIAELSRKFDAQSIGGESTRTAQLVAEVANTHANSASAASSGATTAATAATAATSAPSTLKSTARAFQPRATAPAFQPKAAVAVVPASDASASVAAASARASPQAAPQPAIAAPVPAGAVADDRHLIVLDLNGLLLHRRRDPLPAISGGAAIAPDLVYPPRRPGASPQQQFFVYLRPHVREFLAFLLARFRVGVWSSARLTNIQPMTDLLFGRRAVERGVLAFAWGQEQCTRHGFVGNDRRNKPIFRKPLHRLWAAVGGSGGGALAGACATNTCLLDDDVYKAVDNPPFTALHPVTFGPPSSGNADADADDGAAASGVSRADDGGGSASASAAPPAWLVQDAALSEGGSMRRMLERLAAAASVVDFVRAVNENEGDAEHAGAFKFA